MKTPDECNIHTPLAYLITFNCYGKHLHGSVKGSVKRCKDGHVDLEPNALQEAYEKRIMKHSPFFLDPNQREIVLNVIIDVCRYRRWNLLAAHVRFKHIHVVVQALAPPEKVMRDFKSYSSRTLNRIENRQTGITRWARHGSTRYLWNAKSVKAAVRYVVARQGEPMSVFMKKPNQLKKEWVKI